MEEDFPSTISAPKSVYESSLLCISFYKEVPDVSGLTVEDASVVGVVKESSTKGFLAKEFGSISVHFM